MALEFLKHFASIYSAHIIPTKEKNFGCDIDKEGADKDQLNSEWLFEVIVSPKMQTWINAYKDFCPTKQIVAKINCLHSLLNHKKSATIFVCMVGQKFL